MLQINADETQTTEPSAAFPAIDVDVLASR